MRLADFKLIDKTEGALTWRIVERIQKVVEEMPKNPMNYFSSIVSQSRTNSIVIDLDVVKKEISINKF
ncbi:MAG: hypothetical protein LUQ65_00995 [Candidatus Helarchaeota archaeon]|nr:hypothetical protein [Candidatus Helarchaeota archaeon]